MLYHFFVLLNIQRSFVHEVVLFLFLRVLYFGFWQWFGCRPFLGSLLSRERQSNFQDIGPSATSRRCEVYFLKKKKNINTNSSE